MFHAPATETKQHSDSTRTQSPRTDSFALAPFVPGYKPMRGQLAHLHSTYGNQAVLRALSQTGPAVQRCSGLRQQGEHGLAGTIDEERWRNETAITSVAPMVQRSTSWAGATVHETRNKAEDSLRGGAPVTWQMLNGTMLKTEADSNSAIKLPVVTTSGSEKDFKAKVDSVPEQKGGDDETVLAPGPWSVAATKAEVKTKFGLAACSGDGNTTFSAIGKPSDDAVYKANRRHEDHHVDDDKVAFETTVVEWDKKVEKAKKDGTEFKGETADAATKALWTAVGGAPKKIANDYRELSNTKGGAFHATPAGGKMSISNAKANADCSTSSIEVTNPS
jgi:hypothetical protein